jgi:hypothetical protein
MSFSDNPQREVGWLITNDHTASVGWHCEECSFETVDEQAALNHSDTSHHSLGRAPVGSRIGWGMLRVHADETESSFERIVGRTIFMDKSLTAHMMANHQVHWRSFTDDMDPCYDGIVSVTWIFTDDDLAYNIDRFCMTDAGATKVFYSVDDIVRLAHELSMPRWEQFVMGHKNQIDLPDSEGKWVEIYA